MRARLVNGLLIPPRSRLEGEERFRLLTIEVARIEGQLDDLTRVSRYPTVAAYEYWQSGAERALALFREEAKQLGEWLEANPAPPEPTESDYMEFWRE